MEPGLQTAQRAAEGILQSDPVLGGICILLALALVGLLLWHFRETGRLHKDNSSLQERLNDELVEQERGFRKELMSTTSEVTKGLETMKQAMALLSARDR